MSERADIQGKQEDAAPREDSAVWCRGFGDSESELAIAMLNDIVDSIVADQSASADSGSLVGGLGGQLLFLWNMSKESNRESLQAWFDEKARLLMSMRSSSQRDFTFGSGVTGQAWLFEYILSDQDDEEYDPEFNSNIDHIVHTYLNRFPWRGEIELLRGIAGLLVYLTRRHRLVDKTSDLNLAMQHLRDEAIYFKPGRCAWSTPAHSVYRVNHSELDGNQFNLGLAHGSPCVTAAIAGAIENGFRSTLSEELLYDSSRWILDQALEKSHGQGRYPSFAGGQSPTRLGWCYGDLSLAITIARAGRLLGASDLDDAAKDLAVVAAEREPSSSGVEDACVCHGSAGLFLSYSILNHYVDDKRVAQAADYWLSDLFDRYRERGLDGLNFIRDGKPIPSKGLLEGYAGVGMVVLSGLSQRAEWTDCLLLPTERSLPR